VCESAAAAVARTSDVMWDFHWLLWKHDAVVLFCSYGVSNGVAILLRFFC
jgi:hypothetical protein